MGAWGGDGPVSVPRHAGRRGGGGGKRPAPKLQGPTWGPAHGLHPRFVVAYI